MNNNPNVYIGNLSENGWRRNTEKDDDEVMEKTPEDVIKILGFDPLEEEIE